PISPRADFVTWCRAHVAVFDAGWEAIGLSKEQSIAFDTATKEAETAILEQEQMRQALLVATERAQAAVQTLRDVTGAAVRRIRAFAGSSDDPLDISNTARIAPSGERSPAAPPAKPTGLAVTLDAASGALTLRWKASNPRGTEGTAYIVRRKLPGEAAF